MPQCPCCNTPRDLDFEVDLTQNIIRTKDGDVHCPPEVAEFLTILIHHYPESIHWDEVERKFYGKNKVPSLSNTHLRKVCRVADGFLKPTAYQIVYIAKYGPRLVPAGSSLKGSKSYSIHHDWSKEDITVLLEGRQKGVPVPELARQLRRSFSSVDSKLVLLERQQRLGG